ncbi:unnamed protein product [Chrysoparadoxa australica]
MPSPAVAKVLAFDNLPRGRQTKLMVQEAIKTTQKRVGDTGSSDVQIAALTVKITQLEEHRR